MAHVCETLSRARLFTTTLIKPRFLRMSLNDDAARNYDNAGEPDVHASRRQQKYFTARDIRVIIE